MTRHNVTQNATRHNTTRHDSTQRDATQVCVQFETVGAFPVDRGYRIQLILRRSNYYSAAKLKLIEINKRRREQRFDEKRKNHSFEKKKKKTFRTMNNSFFPL